MEEQESPFWPKDRLYDWVRESDDVLLVAEYDGEIIGYILSQLHELTGKAVLENMYVDPLYRRKGVGTKLVTECLDRLREKDCRYVAALTKTSNETTQEFMQRNGFTVGNEFVWVETFL